MIKLRRATSLDIPALQKICDEAPSFSRRVNGRDPLPTEGAEMLTELPPNKTLEDKFVYLFTEGPQVVGCADVARGYPTEQVAWIGLLLFSENHQGRGFGKQAYALLENEFRAWPQINEIRLSVIMTNAQAVPFWKKMGFRQLGELRVWKAGEQDTELLVMQKTLPRES